MLSRRWMLTATTLILGSAFVLSNAEAATPIQFSGYNIIGPVEEHVYSIGNDQDHVLVVVRAVGANQSTGKTSFLDGARVTGTTWSDMTKGSGVAHGYVDMKDREGTWLMSIDEKNHMVMADGKPHYESDGTWEFLSGTGRYASGQGNGTSKIRCTPSPTDCTVEWGGTFTPKE